MTKDQKKAAVSDILDYFKLAIHSAIDADTEEDLLPLEMVVLTVKAYYQRALIEYHNAQLEKESLAAANAPDKIEPTPQITASEQKGAVILPFKPVVH